MQIYQHANKRQDQTGRTIVSIHIKTNMSSEHSLPTDGLTCLCCWSDIDGSSGLYAEYRAHASDIWRPSQFCRECIVVLLDTQWKGYTEKVLGASTHIILVSSLMRFLVYFAARDDNLQSGTTATVRGWTANQYTRRESASL